MGRRLLVDVMIKPARNVAANAPFRLPRQYHMSDLMQQGAAPWT